MAWIGAAISVVGGLIASDASGDAADQQREAAGVNAAEQKRQFDLTREDFAPYREAGRNALAGIQGLLKNPAGITQDAGYQFGLSQGQAAIDRSASSRGGLYSGATLKALQRYGQDYGSTKMGESFNRLASVAGIGQTATGSSAAAGANYANAIGQNALGLGNAQAANALNQGNIWGNALNQGVSAYGRMQNGGPGGNVAPGAAYSGGLSQDWWNTGGDY